MNRKKQTKQVAETKKQAQNQAANTPGNEDFSLLQQMPQQAAAKSTARYCLWLAPLACLLIFAAIFALKGIFPFGEKSLLTIDLYQQYAPFHEELRSRLLSGQSLFYSWQGGLGKDMWAQIAYYTASPLSLLILLFPSRLVAEGMTFLIVLKALLAAVSFCYVLLKVNQYYYAGQQMKNEGLLITMLAVFYTFCGFFAAFYWNVMWLETMALFPLVFLGIDDIAKGRGYLRFLFSFALTFWCNFFMGVLVLILSVVFFVCNMVISHNRQQLKAVPKKAAVFAAAVAIGLLGSMVIIIPTINALSTTDAVGGGFSGGAAFFTLLDFISQHLAGAEAQILVSADGFPNVYSGVLILLIAPLFFTLKQFNRKTKIVAAAMLVFLYLCMSLPLLDYIVHGFHINKGLPHRFTFVYSFFLLYLAYHTFKNLPAVKSKWQILLAAALAVLAVINICFFPNAEQSAKLGQNLLYFNLALLAAYVLIICLAKSSAKGLAVLPVILLLLGMGEAALHYSRAMDVAKFRERPNYAQSMEQMQQALSLIEAQDDGVYRIETETREGINDGSLYHYNSLSLFSSMMNENTAALMQHMGLGNDAVSYSYQNSTPLADMVFGIKYIMAKEAQLNRPHLQYYDSAAGINIYQNTTALPLAFMVTEQTADFDFSGLNPFLAQNGLLRSMSGIEQDMFALTPADNYYMYNLNLEDKGAGRYSYSLTNAQDLTKIPEVSFTFFAETAGDAYLYLHSLNTDWVGINSGSGSKYYVLSSGMMTFYLGNLAAGQKVSVSFGFVYKTDNMLYYEQEGEFEILFAHYDKTALQNGYQALAGNTLQISEFADGLVKGSINSEGGLLFTSIPYSKGWSIYVDGQQTESLDFANYSLLVIDMPAGEHTVEMHFRPSGFALGLCLSTISLCILVLAVSLRKKIML